MARAGQRVKPSPVDGGQVIPPATAFTIGTDGLVRFKFQAGNQPGLYQVSLRIGAEESGLQFWVLDDDPARNPTDLAQ